MGVLRLSPVPRLVVWTVCLSLLFGVTIRTLAVYGPGWVAAIQSDVIPERRALRLALEAPDMADLRAFYAARNYKPIWIQRRQLRREASNFFDRLALSGREDLDPQAYGVKRLAQLIAQTPSGSPAVGAQAELGLSHAFASYVADLHTPLAGAQLIYTDAALRPPWRPSQAAIIARLESEPTLSAAIADATRMNPIYEQFRQALGDPELRADPDTRRLLLANLERARALPVNLGPRFVLVDVAGAQLWLYDNGRVSDSMKVIVGKPSEPTPMMAGVIRYAVFNPYWECTAGPYPRYLCTAHPGQCLRSCRTENGPLVRL